MSVTEDEVVELLGDRAEESIVERITHVDATIDDVREALEDLEFQMRFGEEREAPSPTIEELRGILEELPRLEEIAEQHADEDLEEEEAEGLSVVSAEELQQEL